MEGSSENSTDNRVELKEVRFSEAVTVCPYSVTSSADTASRISSLSDGARARNASFQGSDGSLSGFMRGWSRGVRLAIVGQYLNQTMTAIVLGALFDAYLLVLRGSKTFVGTLESARGLSSLAMAFPLGWAGDRWSKPLVLRCNTLVCTAAALFLLVGIPSNSVPLLFAGSVTAAIANQCMFGIMPALLSEMTEPGTRRMKALSHQQTASSLGLASGPALQLLLMLVTGTSEWETYELHWVLCSGLLLLPPFVYVVWQIRTAHLAGASECQAAAETGQGAGGTGSVSPGSGNSSPLLSSHSEHRCPWTLAILVEVSSLITAVGSGMTFKYWPLFFKDDFGFSPEAVCAMQLATWGSIAASAQLTPKLAEKVGRGPAVVMLQITGVSLLFVISLTKLSTPATVLLVLLRNSVMNAASPLVQSIVMDMVPKQHRGKWSSIASLRRMSWSGSAFVGGVLSDSHDYRFAFFVTACVHSAATVVLTVVALMKP